MEGKIHGVIEGNGKNVYTEGVEVREGYDRFWSKV